MSKLAANNRDNDVPGTLPIDLLSLAVLLYHVQLAAQSQDELGFYDCSQTLQQMVRSLSVKTYIKTSDLESALWSTNILSEVDLFKHPLGYDFQRFLGACVPSALRFNRTYNILETISKIKDDSDV